MDRLDYFLSLLKPGEGHWASRIIPDGEVTVSNDDVLAMLKAYQAGDISYEQLLDWANLLLFNDAFVFDDDNIRTYLDRIEESDESGYELNDNDVSKMIKELTP